MKIFIDESGNFAESSDWGVVCGLAIPHKEIGPASRELKFRSQKWPTENGEIKGRLLDPVHFHELVEVLYRHDAVLHSAAINIATEDYKEIDNHKRIQGEKLTQHLGPEHHPELVAQIWRLRSTLEKMPSQLYVQCVLQTDLIAATVEDTANYFSQRRPRELANFEWSVDAKDPNKITTQEEWWRLTLGPLLESRSMRQPFGIVRDEDFDVSYFEKSYLFEKEQWYPDRPREMREGYDIRKIVLDSVTFDDSRSDILLQAVDVLANHLRRVMAGRIENRDVIRSLGRLQIPRRKQSVRILSLAPVETKKYLEGKNLMDRIGLMAATGRDMFTAANRRKNRKDKQPPKPVRRPAPHSAVGPKDGRAG